MLTFLGITALSVRFLARFMPAGFHSSKGTAAWASWLSNLLLAKTLVSVYPIYASILTPLWMRMLGARVGKHVEISTMETIPHLTSLGDRSFMADHSLASSPRVRGQLDAPGPLQPSGRSPLSGTRASSARTPMCRGNR